MGGIFGSASVSFGVVDRSVEFVMFFAVELTNDVDNMVNK